MHNFNVKVELTSADAAGSPFLLSENKNKKGDQVDK